MLMCPPTHYSLQYEINPWMKLRHPPDTTLAAKQWDRLCRVLRGLGVQVKTLSQVPGAPDMVFTANAGVVSGRLFIPSHFRYKERRIEEAPFKAFFKKNGYLIVDAAKRFYFEGEGDLLPYRGFLFGGYRFRSQPQAQLRVSRALKKPLIGLDLVNPHFYHLDTCFCPIDERTVMYYPGAFDVYGLRLIRECVKDPLPVSRADADQFACNAFRVGQTIVLNRASASLKRALKKRGYRVIETPTSEFIKAGGSVKCLLLKL